VAQGNLSRTSLFPIDLSVNGALTADDVQVLKTGYSVNLPRDQKNRSVVYLDVSKRRPEMKASPRTAFFGLQCFMENEVSRRRTDEDTSGGYTFLVNISNPHAVGIQSSNLNVMKSLMHDCMPLSSSLRVYVIYISATGRALMPLCINTSECSVPSFFCSMSRFFWHSDAIT
jgi:hypothetical protein